MTENEFFDRVLAGDPLCDWDLTFHNLYDGMCVHCGETFDFYCDGKGYYVEIKAYVITARES